MHNVSLEESRKHVSVNTPGGIFIYRRQTEFSQFVMDVVEHIHELGLQRAVVVVQEGVPETVIRDVAERIAELLEGEGLSKEGRQVALECFHGLTRAEIRKLKRRWKKSRHNPS